MWKNGCICRLCLSWRYDSVSTKLMSLTSIADHYIVSSTTKHSTALSVILTEKKIRIWNSDWIWIWIGKCRAVGKVFQFHMTDNSTKTKPISRHHFSCTDWWHLKGFRRLQRVAANFTHGWIFFFSSLVIQTTIHLKKYIISLVVEAWSNRID